jgi:hypothetical protein
VRIGSSHLGIHDDQQESLFGFVEELQHSLP